MMAYVRRSFLDGTPIIHSHALAHDLHNEGRYFLLDCRPVLQYNSCHISGAVNVNFTTMIKKRFVAGKISLTDLLTTEDGKEKFKNCVDLPTVVYDECTSDLTALQPSTAVILVINALEKMGKCPLLLQGGLNEFGVLHPSLCEVSVPVIKKSVVPAARATTPGAREQPLDWQTAPPVHVLSFLVLGSEKDAKTKEVIQEFNIKYVLNVTPKCPNYFEEEGVVYKRIAVIDTGTQKLSNHFLEAFEFIETARKTQCCILIHCMAGISRSVTLTIAYLIYHFGMSMQGGYQFVKEKRPAISPNLNFMGQLVEFEREVQQSSRNAIFDLKTFLPTPDQEKKSDKMRRLGTGSSSSSAENTPEASKAAHSEPLFVLKLPAPRHKKRKNKQLNNTENAKNGEEANSDTAVIPAENESSSERAKAEELRVPDHTIQHNADAKVDIVENSKDNPVAAACNQRSVSPVLWDLETEHKVKTAIRSFERLSLKDPSSSQ